MLGQLQRGINIERQWHGIKYHSKLNKTFALVFLRVKKNSDASEIKECISDLWQVYGLLRKGMVHDNSNCRISTGSMTILLGFGLGIFEVPQTSKSVPRDLRIGQFNPPKEGKPIVNGSGILYGNRKPLNLGLREHIVIQIISESQLATYRAVQYTWKTLHPRRRTVPVSLSRIFTGFQRDDGRGWLGFHDEISNMKDIKERKNAIMIDRHANRLTPDDLWTEGGTYLAFLRINIDLARWERINLNEQELIVGRQKSTGRPLVGVNEKGKPIIQNAKSNGTRFTSKSYRDHPDYFALSKEHRRNARISLERSIRILNQSHIGRVRRIQDISSKRPSSRRIFRQSFHFFEASQAGSSCSLKTGLNFISFQNDPSRLLFILTDPHWMGGSSFGGKLSDPNIGKVFSVEASGVFYIPRDEKPFPGSELFV
jgi:Dyp-type peroxidase family